MRCPDPSISRANVALQGVNGLTARDIKLVVDGGYNTVEAIAYTYVSAAAVF